MLISTRGRYALRIMIDLASRGSGRYVPLNELAEAQRISEKYLENIIAPLSRAGVVEAARGKGGGYRLAGDPEGCTAWQILELAEQGLAAAGCQGEEGCDKASACPTRPLWRELDALLRDYLSRVTLRQLLDGEIPAAVR